MVAAYDATQGPRIRLGMVGGGQGAFIGAVHRIAARLDGHYDLVAGALSSDPLRATASAAELGIDPERSYTDFGAMARAEAARTDGIEAVAIVTPNHMHFPVARAFLEAGIHVICDKPLTSTLADARELAEIARASGRLFVLTHNYTGYPMIRQARAMVADGTLGDIRLVQVEYAQDWLSEKVEATGNKQAAWRTDPARSGAGGALGDIGTHAFNLASFVSGLHLDSLAADLSSFVEGRALDDNANVLLRFKPARPGAVPARGILWASQVAAGNENALTLRIYGTKGGLEWSQEHPNHLWYGPLNEPKRMLTRAGAGANAAAAAASRVPGGHPEGYLEGFATLYAEAAQAIRAMRGGRSAPDGLLLPTVEDGVAGVAFVEACVESSRNDAAWVKL
jgi:Predicted dehydrogenases and related proteins